MFECEVTLPYKDPLACFSREKKIVCIFVGQALVVLVRVQYSKKFSMDGKEVMRTS